MAIKLITPPAFEPVSLDEAKLHIKQDDTIDDTLITALIMTAREYCEDIQNRALITQTWELWLDAWPKCDYIKIPKPPLQFITSIKYYGTDNAEYTMSDNDYFTDDKSEPGRVVLTYSKSWPTTTLRPANGVVVRYIAGYGTASAVPQGVKQAMLLLVGHWYENREAVQSRNVANKEIEYAVKSLLSLNRVVPV